MDTLISIIIIYNRIYEKLDNNISEFQFGFRNGADTRKTLFVVNVPIQRCLDVNKNIYACTIDYEKAFDKVRNDKTLNYSKRKTIRHSRHNNYRKLILQPNIKHQNRQYPNRRY